MGNITGSVQIKNGRYYAVISYKEDGKWKHEWHSTGFDIKGNKKKAQAVLQRLLLERDEKPKQTIQADMKFCDLLLKWLESSKLSIRESTYRNYLIVMKAHLYPYFKALDVTVSKLKPYHLEEYYALKIQTLSSSTIQKHHANLYSALEYARKNGFVDRNVAEDARVPSRHRKQIGAVYTANDISKLKKAIAGSKIEVPVMLIICLGLRRSEALGLKWDAVDFTRHEVTIRAVVVVSGTETTFVEATKSEASERVLPLSEELEKYLKQVKDRQDKDKLLYGDLYFDEGFVCAREDGGVIKPYYLTTNFKKLLLTNNLPVIRLHDLRHSAATNLITAGFSVKDVASWLGHADATTTLNIYSHVLDKSKAAMANVLSSNEISNGNLINEV